ncbi:MAG TPA: L,D-transpeptidase [Chloroflexia bacterium]|nr:L,D-transpeptidase [Chloroflexia bacterium]
MATSKLTRSGSLLERRMAFLMALLMTVSVTLLAFGAQNIQVAKADNQAPTFANDFFKATWQRTDLPIQTSKASRSWYWGPQPQTVAVEESYADSPGGKRIVQYFDKARMEINNPSKNVVTNGLLVVEMINGKLQQGDSVFTNTEPARIPIAGDSDNPFPTYADLGGVYLKARDAAVGQFVTDAWTPKGVAKQNQYANDPGTKIAVKQNGLGIPAAFWNFLSRKGPVYTSGDYQEDTISNWLFSTGYPVTEAYWTRVKVGGQEKDVLFQAFERRTLTYTPSNPEAFQVEMGNVGLHYLYWRYPKGVPQFSDPLAQTFAQKQPDWYVVTGDVLNVRTAPSSQAPLPERTANLPYVQQLVKGNHIQALREVKGEEILPGNSTWYQFYEKPDLYVYSGFVQKMTLPDYPTPPHYYQGLWVSVDLSKQMMGVFYNNQLLYKTLIASGIPSSDPEKDHSTPVGVFHINGSYRPASQTMEGGTGDKASGGDYYKLDDIRYVNYFFQDYAIHGTYWHARFGIYPQSHGCVNSTTYDASLIFKLKAGTTVEVFKSASSSVQSTNG